jgi:general secretion pathway protein I
VKSDRRAGFTLLEVIVSLAILGLSLMAIFDLNAGAVAMHSYTKKLTVASLLARSKMIDIEQELYDKGFNNDDEEKSGDFSDEGWSTFKWRAKILAPKTQGVSPDQLISAIFNVPLTGDGAKNSPLSLLFGSSSSSSSSTSSTSSDKATSPASANVFAGLAGAGSSSSSTSALGPAAGLMQGQFNQMVDQITKAVREVHLTVSWREGKQLETLDVVTHVVSMGPGSDRNGNLQAATLTAAANAQQQLQPPGGPRPVQPPPSTRRFPQGQ